MVIERLYNRKKRPEIAADVFGTKMILEPTDCVERQILFSPQLYEWREISNLRKHLKAGDTFLDAGANVGFYSLIASEIVGEKGKIISVEADPYNASRLRRNLEINGAKNVCLMNVGLSDKAEILKLGLSGGNNRGGHSFLYDSPNSVSVGCKPLADILRELAVSKIDGAKFDIEGFEFKVLQRFFKDSHSNLWPKFFLIEYTDRYAERAGGNVLHLLRQHGYNVVCSHEDNYFANR